jgi:hypothetical protein
MAARAIGRSDFSVLIFAVLIFRRMICRALVGKAHGF